MNHDDIANAKDKEAQRYFEEMGNAWTEREELQSQLIFQRRENAMLREALVEARRWIGDGDMADPLAEDHWTPEYKAAVQKVDNSLSNDKADPRHD